MNQPTARIRNRLERAVGLLEEDHLLSISPEQRQLMKEETRKLKSKLDAIESGYLNVGLLGGTGVGKSTLMNALAESQIATTSHRRPHTDHVLIYHHVEADPIPDLGLAEVPWKEIAHSGDAIRHILLCDLPDFDSIRADHRQQVLRFLERLDVLVWIASPEKYADGRFYHFLSQVPKAHQNFYFILNKVDLLFEERPSAKGYEALGEVMESFERHIHDTGVSDPLLYSISAHHPLQGINEPWNQFPAFRRHLFHQRDIKQIGSIKTANLDAETRGLFSVFQEEAAGLKRFVTILTDALSEMEKTRSAWRQAGNEAFELWLAQIHDVLVAQNIRLSALVGPTYGIGIVLRSFRRPSPPGAANSPDLSLLAPPDAISSRFQKRLKWLEDRVSNRLLRENVPKPQRDLLGGALDTRQAFVGLGERFFDTIASALARPGLPAFRAFRIRQFATYALLLVLLLFALGGVDAWHQLIREVSWGSLVDLFFAGVGTLFAPKGLAALASYGLLNIFFGFYYYRRYGKLVERTTRKMVSGLAKSLRIVWEEELDRVIQRVESLRDEVQSRRGAMTSLLEEP